MTPTLSIIVPMYKVEAFLTQCLDSLLRNPTQRIEIIAVNDGSPDRSGEIAEEYASKDDRIRVIHQKNGGLSAARNHGLSEARGEYIWFIDSDDWVSDDAIETILEKIDNEHPEAIHLCGADVIEGKPQKLFALDKVAGKHHTGIEMLKSNNFHGVVQYTVYRHEFFKRTNLRFYEGIYHEDTEFSPKAYYYLKDIVPVDKVLYLKRVNDDSITRTVNPKKNYDLVKVTRSLLEFSNSLPEPENKNYFLWRTANVLKMALTNEVSLMDIETKKKFNAHLYDNRDLLEAFDGCGRLSYKLQGAFLRLFSKNMLFAYHDVLLNDGLRKLTGRKEKIGK